VTNLDQFYGAQKLDSLFPRNLLRTIAPFPAASRRKDVQDYDPDIVRDSLNNPPKEQGIDPRTLRSTQPSLTRAGVAHYLGRQWNPGDETFADKVNPGNESPFVYQREGQNVLLSGHHRAAAALLRGEDLQARVVSGPWGPPRTGK